MPLSLARADSATLKILILAIFDRGLHATWKKVCQKFWSLAVGGTTPVTPTHKTLLMVIQKVSSGVCWEKSALKRDLAKRPRASDLLDFQDCLRTAYLM